MVAAADCILPWRLESQCWPFPAMPINTCRPQCWLKTELGWESGPKKPRGKYYIPPCSGFSQKRRLREPQKDGPLFFNEMQPQTDSMSFLKARSNERRPMVYRP